MSTFLFHDIVFGPVTSRRLGLSLGLNLLPDDGKICTYDCVYCECGFNEDRKSIKGGFANIEQLYTDLEKRLIELRDQGITPDVLTFAGNGEPTVHPKFNESVSKVKAIGRKYFPAVKVAVLSNGTTCHKPEVFAALKQADMNILKLDSAIETTIQKINQPGPGFNLEMMLYYYKQFAGKLIIQTLFCRGKSGNTEFDNTTDGEISVWIETLKYINPSAVMIYSISRDTPLESVEKIDKETLQAIGKRVTAIGIPVEIS